MFLLEIIVFNIGSFRDYFEHEDQYRTYLLHVW
jgi:hypothetical protein